ncbi:MAG: TolC family protein [Candidatus Cloacimonetes bacterium]|nr:TolC family protein [Candidatus Cloacimonadota bacterium]
MRNTLTLFLLLLLPILLTANVYTLDELIEHGLEHSLEIQKEELSVQSSKSALTSALWSFAPEANISAGINKDFHAPASSASLTSNAGIDISKTISLNDPSYFNYRKALLDDQSAQMKLQRNTSEYAYKVFKAYISVLSSAKKMEALNENLEIQNRVWEQSKTLFRLGKNTPFEVKQNEIAVMNSEISIVQLENTIQNARSELFSLVQLKDEGYPLQELDIDIMKDIPAFDSSNMLQLKLLEQDIKKHDLNITQNSLNYLPKLNLGYGFSRKVSGADFDFDRYNTVHSAYLSLSYPLLSFFTNRESATSQKIAKQLSQLNIEDTVQQSQSEYENSTKALQYLMRLDTLYAEQLEQASAQIEIAQERYRLGLIELLELDKTRTSYIDATLAYENNRYEILKTQESINYLISNPILGKW